ncbi:MAG: hypothetical protein LBE16_09045 [Clostridiales Family XIII bacterium]|jgi:phage protein D|nr:hypothetical protein [Clostridiales Family XIII bacterium]
MSTYDALRKRYDGFAVPAFKITCGGSELKRSAFTFSEIAVDVGMGATAGAARFTLTDVYERGSRRFAPDALKSLVPGKKVSVALGYGSDTTEVFTGYIDELKTRFDEEMTLTALCLDARGLMRSGSAYAAMKDKKIQDAVAAVLDRYAALVTAKDVKLDAWEQEVNLTQAGTDLDYIIEAAEARGLFLRIDKGKAIIGPAQDTVCIEFDWEQFAMEFSVRYLDEKLTAYGYDAQKMEAFTAEAKAKQAAKQEALLTVRSALRLSRRYTGDTAKKHAEALGKTKTGAALFGKISCVGLPEALVGQKVKINKFPLTALGVPDKLIVTAVSHRIERESGFMTEIEVSG